MRQRVLDLEKALAHRESAAKSAQTKAASEVVRLKQKDKELQFKLSYMWDWYNNEITKAGGQTKASSLIAKRCIPMPRQARRSGWKRSRRSRLGRAIGMRRSGANHFA